MIFSSQVSVFDGNKGNCNKISTSGVDGNLIVWDIKVSQISTGQGKILLIVYV